jgi:hypothetical protein
VGVGTAGDDGRGRADRLRAAAAAGRVDHRAGPRRRDAADRRARPEIKEVFGGFTLIECDGLDEALAWAARLPTARDGKVEVRPLLQVASAATGTGAGS